MNFKGKLVRKLKYLQIPVSGIPFSPHKSLLPNLYSLLPTALLPTPLLPTPTPYFLLPTSYSLLHSLLTPPRRYSRNGRMRAFGGGKQVLLDPLSIQIITEVKFLAIELADLAACCGEDDLRRRQVLIGNIGQQSPFGAPSGDIAEMGGGGAEVADLAGEGGAVMIVKPGIGQEHAFVADFTMVGNGDFGVAPAGLLTGLSMEEVSRHRHVKGPENWPEVFEERKGSPPDGNTGLKIGNPVQSIVNPEISFLAMDVVLLRQLIPKDAMLGELEPEADSGKKSTR